MADGVAWRLRSAGLKAATITLKLRDAGFVTITRQTTLEVPADLTEPIFEAAARPAPEGAPGQRIRLVGVTASNFRDREQLELFAGSDDPKRHQAAAAMDTIRRKYGERSVIRGRLVRAGVPTVFERDPNSAIEGRIGVPDEPTGRRRAEIPVPRGARRGRRSGRPSTALTLPTGRDTRAVTRDAEDLGRGLDIEQVFGLEVTPRTEHAFASGGPGVDDNTAEGAVRWR